MTKNPIVNALTAVGYISLVSTLMFFGSRLFGGDDTVLAPIAMLSLFSLSAATMAYIFLYQPFLYFVEGEKKKAVNLFLQTTAAFAIFTLLMFGGLVFGRVFNF